MFFELIPRLLAVSLTLASAIEVIPYSLPDLQYSAFGGSLGLFGSFDSVSLFEYFNASSTLETTKVSPGYDRIFFYDSLSSLVLKVAEINGQVSDMIPLTDSSVLINGNFTSINNQSLTSPVIYSIKDDSFVDIRAPNMKRQLNEHPGSFTIEKRDDESLVGTVSCMLKDDDLIYMGGDLLYNNTYGVVMYDYKSQKFLSTPFLGFGKGSQVNAISKISGTGDSGSIIFGGSFDSLGLPQLLTHITTSVNMSKNSTDPVFAEQAISLKSATFSSVNGAPDNDNAAVIDPSSLPLWKTQPNVGSEWLVMLPPQMLGVTPSKARIHVPPGPNGIKFFRIYTQPSNGIMNLTYIDPETNEIRFCDAWCPLSTMAILENATSINAARYNDSDATTDSTVILEDGTFVKYADSNSRVKALAYSTSFQDFGFVNKIEIDALTLTTVAWYGDNGAFSGFELYTDSITVYANQALNQPNSNLDADAKYNNLFQVLGGTFTPISQIVPTIRNTDYMVAMGTDAKVDFYPNITYTGNYLITMRTPGCLQDNSCLRRPIVNVEVLDARNNILSTHQIYQNNDYDKYDTLYSGPLVGTSENTGSNRVEVTFLSTIDGNSATPWMVLDSVLANIIELDPSKFPSNDSKSKNTTTLLTISLNGLFEYSLANFTDFDVAKVYNVSSNVKSILPLNVFVGMSSLNELSSQLSNMSLISDITVQRSDPPTIILQGDFQSNSTNLTLSNSNLLTLKVNEYSSESNSTNAQLLVKRALYKRDSSVIAGATFNASVSKVFAFQDCAVYVGKFSLSNTGNSATVLKDLSNSNKLTTQINNFALRSNDEWYGFGNLFIDADFTNFANVTIQGKEYFIFSSPAMSSAQVWDNTAFSWILNSNWDIINAVSLDGGEHTILSGSSFSVFNHTFNDQAVLSDGNAISSYDFGNTDNGSYFTSTFWVNKSLSVAGGRFTAGDISNVVFINNTDSSAHVGSLQGQHQWSPNAEILSLYVDSSSRFLYMGFLGFIQIGNANISGLAIYDLKNNSFTTYQPAALQTTNDRPIKVNSMAFYDDGNQLLVGGDFDTAGSLTCTGMCIYDIANTRWINPVGASSSPISGEITTIRFVTTLEVLLSGNITIGNDESDFVTYDLTASQFVPVSTLRNSGAKSTVERYIINDLSVSSTFNTRLISYGSGFVYAFDGLKWYNIDDDIVFDENTKFHDMRLLQLTDKNLSNNGSFFDSNKVVALAGEFTLREFGQVNVALYNGTNWNPFLFTSNLSAALGSVRSLLTRDLYKFQSSDELMKKLIGLSDGKVVAISLACALASTVILGLLYLIPFFLLFRDHNISAEQRIKESDMVDAVSPQELLHEIEVQRQI